MMSAPANQHIASVPVADPFGSSADRNEVLNVLFTLHYADLVRLARLLVDDRASAEDVVMDAFAGLSRRWFTLRDADRAKQYLRRAVVNGSRSRLRHRRVARRRDGPTVFPAASSAEDQVMSNDERDSVVAQLRRLPSRQRQVLVLRYYLDLSEAEIAAELSISRGSVKTHASRGLNGLAQGLEGSR